MDSSLTAEPLNKIKRRAYLATKGQGSLLRLGETLLDMVGREAQLREALQRIERGDAGLTGPAVDIARAALKSVGSENG